MCLRSRIALRSISPPHYISECWGSRRPLHREQKQAAGDQPSICNSVSASSLCTSATFSSSNGNGVQFASSHKRTEVMALILGHPTSTFAVAALTTAIQMPAMVISLIAILPCHFIRPAVLAGLRSPPELLRCFRRPFGIRGMRIYPFFYRRRSVTF
jgi:hypothetical protein